MSKRFFVDDELTDDGKYRVLQEDSETKERFGVNDFDTREEAERTADIMQKPIDAALSEEVTLTSIEVPPSSDDNSDAAQGGKFKDTLQDIKDGGSQD